MFLKKIVLKKTKFSWKYISPLMIDVTVSMAPLCVTDCTSTEVN